MPTFSARSRERLETCHVDWQVICNELIKHCDFTVVEGFRGKEDQNRAYDAGRSQLRWPDSKHNHRPSLAVDLAPYVSEIKNIDWEDIKAFCVLKGMLMMVAARLLAEGRITHQVRWGGDWDRDGRTVDQTFHDLPHYELIPAD